MEGQGNLAVVALLAEALDIAKGRVRIVRGQTSHEKLVAVDSLTPEQVRQRLPAGNTP